MNILLITLGLICITYDFTLIFLNPGTFLDNLTSFTHIWLLAGGLLIFAAVYRKKTGRFFWKTWKKWLKLTVGSLLSAGFFVAVINLAFILNPKTTEIDEDSDYLILLGGGIDKDGKLPASVLNRVNKAAEYLNQHKNVVCVVTGGTLKWLPYPEAPEIKRQLVAAGVEESRVLVEDQALDTIQNFQFSCKILADYEGLSKSAILKKRFVVVTNSFHLRRAERLAARMGFENVKGIAAKTPAIYVAHDYLREIGAYVKLNARIILTGKPKNIV